MRKTIARYTCFTVLLICMALTTFVGHSMSENLPKAREDAIWKHLIIAALKVEQSNVEAITVAKTMAIAQETGLFGKRKESSHYAKKILEEYPQFTGAYFAYEPNADQDDKAYLRQVGTEKGG